MSDFLNRITTNWKTSLAGFLSFVSMTLITVTGFMGANDVNTEGVLQTHTKYVAYANIAVALCRVWIGLLQHDAGTQTALVPGKGVQSVPSHEIPDSPNAIPVIKP